MAADFRIDDFKFDMGMGWVDAILNLFHNSMVSLVNSQINAFLPPPILSALQWFGSVV